MGCKFERISEYKNSDIPMPVRKTKCSAGYDFCAVEDVTIPSIFSSVSAIALERVGREDFRDKLVQTMNHMSEDIGFLIALHNKDIDKVSVILKEYFSSYEGFFTLSLEDVQEIIKKANKRFTLVPTGMKCRLEPDQVLHLFIRSSSAVKANLMLGNGVGVIDADYYNNKDNEGHIFFPVINLSPFNIIIKKGDIIGQGEINRYCITEDDSAEGERVGGIGSTTEK